MGPFEPFDPTTPTQGRAATVRFLSQGRILLNAAAGRLLGGAEWVQLLWDEETGRLALKPTQVNDPMAVKVVAGNSQWVITSKAFVESHEIPLNRRLLLAERDGLLVASTLDPGNPLG